MKNSERTFWLVCLLAALIVSVVAYAPVFTGKIPFPANLVFDFPAFAPVMPDYISTVQTNTGDLVTSFYPYRTLAAQAVREGTLPLWNPYMLSGAPFLANSQSALFYPGNFLYYILPVPIAWSIGFFVRRMLAVLFTTLFLRRAGATRAGAITGGLMYAFCGFLTAWQGQAMSDAAVWLPLMCYSVMRLHDEPEAFSIVLAAFTFSMPVFAGHPETAAHLTLTVIAFAVFLWIRDRRFAFVKAFTISGLLAVGLAAVQILPTVEWLKYIHHSLKDPWPAVPLWSIVGLVSRDIARAKNSAGLLMPEHASYIAVMAFVAAPVAFFRKSSRAIALFFGLWTLAVFSEAFSLGPVHWIVQHVSILKMLKNSRLVLVSSFGLAVLAGLGISAVQEWRWTKSKPFAWGAVIAASMGSAVAFVLIYLIHRVPVKEIIEFQRLPRFSLYLLMGSFILVSARLAGRLPPAWFAALTLTLVAVDVTSLSYGTIPFTRPRDVFPRIELFDRLPKQSTEPYRVAQVGYAYGTNFELMYGHGAVGGYELSLERLKNFVKDVSRDEMDSVTLTPNGVLEKRDRRLDMLNARYIIVSEWDPRYKEFREQPERFRFLYTYGDTDVFENLKAFPPAYLVPVSGVEVIPDDTSQLERLKDPRFNPERGVIVSEPPPAPFAAEPTPPVMTTPKTEWTARRVNDFELDINAFAPSVLVVSQIHYPGWKAYVDGNSVPVTRANYAFPAIFIPSGPHHVRFSFEPWTFKAGLSVTILTLVLFGVMIRSEIGRSAEGHI
jgi:hypothetical protein